MGGIENIAFVVPVYDGMNNMDTRSVACGMNGRGVGDSTDEVAERARAFHDYWHLTMVGFDIFRVAHALGRPRSLHRRWDYSLTQSTRNNAVNTCMHIKNWCSKSIPGGLGRRGNTHDIEPLTAEYLRENETEAKFSGEKS